MGMTKFVTTRYIKSGKGQQVATIPWISSDFAAPTSVSLGSLPSGFGLGQFWYDEFGNTFVCRQAKNSTAFTIGQVAQMDVAAVDTVAASTTTRVVNLVTGGLTANAERGNFLLDKQIGNGTTGATKTDCLKVIKENTASSLTVSYNIDTQHGTKQIDADAYVTAPSSAVPDNLTIIRPNRVKPFDHTQLVEIPTGIAVSAIASATTGNFGVFQVGGLAIVAAKGDVTALAPDAPAVPDGTTDGVVKGAAALAYGQVGISQGVFAAASGLTAVMLTLPNPTA